jgi:hypothetical protein
VEVLSDGVRIVVVVIQHGGDDLYSSSVCRYLRWRCVERTTELD